MRRSLTSDTTSIYNGQSCDFITFQGFVNLLWKSCPIWENPRFDYERANSRDILQAYLVRADNASQELYSNDTTPNRYLLNTLSICLNLSAVIRWINISLFYTYPLPFSNSPANVIFKPSRSKEITTIINILQYFWGFVQIHFLL